MCVCVCVPNFVRIGNLKIWRSRPYLFLSATEKNNSFARNLGVLETGDRAASIPFVGTHGVYRWLRGTCAETV